MKSNNGQTIRTRIEAFDAHAQRADGCWLWNGSINRKGYGYTKIGGRSGVRILAHRLAWELFMGAIPEGMCVLHRCDNPPCCNPEHIFLGSIAVNNADMAAKGRAPWHSKPGPRKTLTEEQALAAIARVASGETRVSVARSFGVGHGTINAIVSGKSWKHLARVR